MPTHGQVNPENVEHLGAVGLEHERQIARWDVNVKHGPLPLEETSGTVAGALDAPRSRGDGHSAMLSAEVPTQLANRFRLRG